MNTAWILHARRAFAELYGGDKGLAVCNAVIPGVMADFRRMLRAAPEGRTVSETYRLDDGRGALRIEGRREADACFVTGLSLAGRSIELNGDIPL